MGNTAMVNTGLDLVKGADIINMLQFHGKISDEVTFDLPQGSVVHVNADGEFETGATGHQVPMFLWRAANSLDVANPGINDDGSIEWVSPIPSGRTTAFPVFCGMEIASARFDDGETYGIGDFLRGQTENDDITVGGVLTKAGVTLGTNCICGVVSRGVLLNPTSRKNLLYFWPWWGPVTSE